MAEFRMLRWNFRFDLQGGKPVRTFMLGSVTLLLLCASTVAGADISGRWRAQVPWPGRNLTDFSFTFKVDGAKLTGTATYPLGDNAYRLELMEGKVGGDDVSFVVVSKRGTTETRMIFKGKVVGAVINFTLDVPPLDVPPAAGGPPPAGQAGAPPPAAPLLQGGQFTAKRTGS
jgi:hypothetical protein